MFYAAAFLHGTSYSFPSGHAMESLVGYGMEAAAAKRLRVVLRTYQRERISCVEIFKADTGQYSISIPARGRWDDDSLFQ
jgi:hypothetical protein